MKKNSVNLEKKQSNEKENKIRRYWYKYSRNLLSVLGAIVVAIIVFVAIFATYICPYPESAGNYINFAEASQPPSFAHFCGTDVFGRDIFSRILFGSRLSLLMGITVVSIAAQLGIFLGLIAGYNVGNWISIVIMRIVDIFISIPALMLALVVCSILTPGVYNAMLAVSFSWWAWYARLVYGIASSTKGEFFIQAAEVNGASSMYIIFNEILPNCLSPILTKMSLDMASVILIASSISFVGLGAQPPTPDLGTMVADGAKYLPELWWMSVLPAIAIIIIILAFNLVGDGVRDMFGSERG